MAPSFWQLLIVLLIVVLLFGAGKIPRLMGDVAKGIRSFRSGLKEEDQPAQDEASPRQIDGEATTTSTTGASTRNDETART